MPKTRQTGRYHVFNVLKTRIFGVFEGEAYPNPCDFGFLN
jgi:hypothetical protein